MPLWICLRWHDPSGAATRRNAALHRLALAMLQYSPQVACFRHDAIVLEVSASLSLFGGVRRLCRRVRSSAAGLSGMAEPPRIENGSPRMGLAPSAAGAWLLAAASRPARRRVVRTASLARHLAGLPLHCLPETGPHRHWLEGIGCRRLGDLRALPRQGLQQRTSPGLVHALDAAYAQTPETLAWFEPPAVFRLMLEPDFHLSRDTAILAAAQPLLQALCGWLQHRQQVLHDFVLVLHHEKGRHAAPPTRVALRFSAAAWRLEAFNLLLKERLSHVLLQRAAIRLELISGPPHPRAPASDTLFPDPSRQAHEEDRLLDLLEARLGADGIRRPRPRSHHLPEHANTWAAGHHATPAPAAWPRSVGARARPFWLLPVAQRLDIHHERPLHQGRPLRLVQGPERIETGWNEGEHHRRDYFVAEDPDGARYWIYREREAGEGWFLHGLFA